MVFAMHLSKLVLFNVRFEVLIVVNVGCYAIQCDERITCVSKEHACIFRVHCPEDECSRVLEDSDTSAKLYGMTSQKMVTCKCTANCIIIMLLSWSRATC